MISIIWSATVEDDADFVGAFAKKHEYLAPDWADSEGNADSAVQDLIERWFGSDEWVELFGEDDDSATILVEIDSPPSIAGRYRVDLDRVVKARANKMVTA